MLPRRNLDPRAALCSLAPQWAHLPLVELGEGFDNVAYAVGEDHLLRISKIADPQLRAATAAKDVALSRFAARHSSLATSQVLTADVPEGVLLGTLVRGHGADRRPPRDADAFADVLAEFLRGLQSAPAAESAAVAGPPTSSAADWLAATTESYEAAAPLLPRADCAPIETFLAAPVLGEDERTAFCHNDLGDEHLIVDGAGRLTGVIDWSDAVLGDPARDVALVLFDFGPGVAERVVTELGRDDHGLLERAYWWALRAGVEGVSWRATHDRPIGTTLDRLRRLLAAG